MNLSLQQAAQILGKTRRQILYMIEQGRLPAQKIGGRWVIDRDVLPSDPEAQQQAGARRAQFRAAIEDALTTPAGKERRYTMRDIKAVQVATPLYRQLLAHGAGCETAAAHMRHCLDQLALGCHRFDRQEKSAAYRAARDAASLAAMELLLRDGGEETALLDAVEQELMPALAGLLRRMERSTSSHR